MPQSVSNVIVHVVFSTKYRQQLILPEIEDQLFGYIGETINNLDCYTIKVGGYLDHVHCLLKLHRPLSQSKLVEEIKKSSSKWMKNQGEFYQGFYWQDGYGIFSIGPKDIPYLYNYIDNQRSHHMGQNFKEEFISLLDENLVEYNEEYIWD